MKKQIKCLIVAVLAMFVATIGVHADEPKCDGDSISGDYKFILVSGETSKYCKTIVDATDTAQASGDTIKLGVDIEYSESDTSNRIEIKGGKNITFDFNGHTISAPEYESKYSAVKVSGAGTKVTFTGIGSITHGNLSSALLVAEGAEVTIEGGIFKSSGETTTDGKNYPAVSVDSATLTVSGDSVSIIGGIGVFGNEPKLTVSAGNISSLNSFAISGNGSTTHDSKITITGGTIESSTDAAIYHPQRGSLTISGEDTTITGAIGVVVRQGDVTINGGTITGNGKASTEAGENDITVGSNDNKLASGAAVVVDNKAQNYGSDVTVTIEGGKFQANTENAVTSYDDAEDTDNYEITGGEFNKPFTADYAKGSTEVQIGSNYYVGEDATEAVENATNGQTVEVLQGDLTVENVPEGVTVTNKGEGKVEVDGTTLGTGQSKYIPVTHYSAPTTSEENEKDIAIVEGVTYEDNGDDIEIEGSVVVDSTDVYAAMLKYANDKGYKNLYNMYEFHVKDGKSLTNPLVITFDLGKDNDGKTAYILHQKHDNTYDEYTATVTNGKVKIRVYELSPFIVMLGEREDRLPENPPKTSVIGIMGYGVLSLSSLGTIISLKKKRK